MAAPVIAFVNIPNGQVGQPTAGTIVGNYTMSSVVLILDNATDADTAVASVPDSDGRAWNITMTPTRIGVINGTIQARTSSGLTGERRISIIAVGADATSIPAGGSPAFRRVLPGPIGSPVPCGDNSFWMINAVNGAGSGTYTIDGFTYGEGYRTTLLRFDASGNAVAKAHITTQYPWNFAADEAGNLYAVVSSQGAAAALVNQDGSTFATLGTSSNTAKNRWLCKLGANGVWQWSRRYDRYASVSGGFAGMAVADGHLYFITDGGTYDNGSGSYSGPGNVLGHVRTSDGVGTAFIPPGSDGGGYELYDKLYVSPGGVPIVRMTVTGGNVAAASSRVGLNLVQNEQWAIAFAVAATTGTPSAYTRLSSDNTKLKFLGAAVDQASGHTWWNVNIAADGGKTGLPGAELTINRPSGATNDLSPALFSTPTFLGSATPQPVAAVTTGWAGYLNITLIQPGVPTLWGNPAYRVGSYTPASGGDDLVAFFPTSATDGSFGTPAFVTGTGSTIEGGFIAGRAYGGAVAMVSSNNNTGYSYNMTFSPDPSGGAPISVSGSSTRYVLASMDANGSWSTADATAIPGSGGDSFVDVPGFDYGDPGLGDYGDLVPGYDPPAGASTPGAPGPTNLGTIAEDSVLATYLAWADADAVDESQSYTLELAPTATGPWSESGLTLTHGFVSLATSARADWYRYCGVVVVPEADWSGTLTWYARVRKSEYPDDLISGVSTITVTVTSTPDAPSSPTPTRMPTVESGVISQGTFTFVDPDGAPWTVTVSATRDGTYGSTATLTGKGTVSVIDASSTDHQFDLRFTQVTGGYLGSYGFWVKVTDAGGLTSGPVYISGVVSGANVSVELQQVTRGASTVTFTALTPITAVIDMSVTEALDGPGGAELTVAASELARRAGTLGSTVADLIRAGNVEAKVLINSTLVFTGPITGYRHDVQGQTVTLSCTGLMGYLEARAIEGSSPLTYTGVEQSSIAWDLIDKEQAKSYGKLGLTNSTVNTSNVIPSIEFTPNQTVAEALYTLRDRLNGPELWIDPDRTVRTATRRGADKRGSIVFTPQNCSRFELTTDWRVLANVINVYGTGTTGTASDNTSMAKHGRMVKPLNADLITDATAAGTVAANYLGDLKELPEAYYLVHDANPERPFGVLDYGVGDAVSIEADTALGRVTADVRIVNRTIRLVQGTSASFDVELTVERIPSDGVIRGRRSDHNPDVISSLYDALYRR